MSKKNPQRYLWLTGIAIVAIIAIGAYFISQSATEKTNLLPGRLEIAETQYSFGTIGLDTVIHSFTVKNVGEGPLKIERVSTSCGCTTAQLKKGDKTSVIFGMDHGDLPRARMTLEPGEEAEVMVTYDPLAHGLANAAGYFRRSVYIETSNPTSSHTLTIEMTVDPDPNNTAVQKTLFAFDNSEHDFGVVKQSGGIVQHTFPFTYNGTVPINVTGVPTSCQCTRAEINVHTLNPGDSAAITVFFDPNLHEEPEGKFFKTISLLTEPEISETPELTIWVEIDVDLGPEAYKLQFHED